MGVFLLSCLAFSLSLLAVLGELKARTIALFEEIGYNIHVERMVN
jgi:hypothetical protein